MNDEWWMIRLSRIYDSNITTTHALNTRTHKWRMLYAHLHTRTPHYTHNQLKQPSNNTTKTNIDILCTIWVQPEDKPTWETTLCVEKLLQLLFCILLLFYFILLLCNIKGYCGLLWITVTLLIVAVRGV